MSCNSALAMTNSDVRPCSTTHNRSQAIEIAVDAHATRILRAHSPPEACVDSSVGPYVTSILREALSSQNIGQPGSKWTKSSISRQIPDYDSLIELLESQCYMSPNVAEDVIWKIALVVETEEVSDSVISSIHSSFDDNDVPSSTRRSIPCLSSENSSAISARLGRGHRSKSLGSELEYDVNFLGKILREAMEASSATSPTGVVSSSATSGSESIFLFQESSVSDHSSKESNIHGRGVTDGFSSNLTLALESKGHESCCLPPLYPASSKRASIVCSKTLVASSSHFPVSTSNTPSKSFNSSITGPDQYFESNSAVNSSGSAICPNIGFHSLHASKGSKERHVSFDETHLTTFSYMTETEVMNTDEASCSVVLNASSQRDAPHTSSDFFDPLEGVLNILNLEDDDDDEERNENSCDPKSLEENSASESNSDSSQGTNLDGTSGRTIAHSTTDNIPSTLRDGNNPLYHPISSNILSIKPTAEEKSNSIENSAFQPHKKSGRKHQKSSKKEEANDLAAALFFRQSRPRSNSLMDHRTRPSPPIRPLSVSSSSGVLASYNPTSTSSGSGLLNLSLGDVATVPSSSSSTTSATSATTATAVFPSESSKIGDVTSDPVVISSTTQLLLTLNAHLGHEAASLASKLTDGDLNLAQYLIEAARSDTSSGGGNGHRRRPRICRHELHGTCYRSDCPYSHELGGVTCLFWLRGRCRGGNKKGDSPCRFLHGFGERLLDGICEDYLVEQKARKAREEEERIQKQLSKQKEEDERKKAIQTTNLLQHNEWATADRLSQSLPNKTFSFLPLGRGSRSSSPVFGNGCWTASVVNK
ncbi:hypothetical protein ACHAXS_009784 [Conticribra weissflogii]